MLLAPLLFACRAEPPPDHRPHWIVDGPRPQTDPFVEDVFVQAISERVDVLFVVQDTPGADDEQFAVSRYPVELFAQLADVDFHVGVVTTDLADEGRLVEADGVRWIDPGTPDAFRTFQAMVQVGVDGGLPQPTDAAHAALVLQRDAANAGFLRDDAAVHVVLVLDGEDAADPLDLDPAGFVPWFEGLGTARSVSCLLDVEPDDGPVDACRDLVLAVGDGVAADLDDAEAAMWSVGEVVLGIERTYALSRIPADGTLAVEVELLHGAVLGLDEDDWTWDPVANAVTFVAYVPGPGTIVRIRYEPAS